MVGERGTAHPERKKGGRCPGAGLRGSLRRSSRLHRLPAHRVQPGDLNRLVIGEADDLLSLADS